jgi:hypothetical protein
LHEESVKNRELLPLLSIEDGHEKIIIVGEGSHPNDFDGVKVLNAPAVLASSISR